MASGESLFFLSTLYVYYLELLAECLNARAEPCRLLVQFSRAMLMSDLLTADVIERALKLTAYRGLRLIPPQTATQQQLPLNIPQSPLNILFSRVELRFVVGGVLEFIFHLCQAIFVEQEFHHPRVAFGLTPQISHLVGEQSDLS